MVLPLGTKLKHPCPDCGADMVLRNSKYGLFYGCSRFPMCKAAHGAHSNSGEPLGTPADKETKDWRIKAHSAFDMLWKGNEAKMNRREAYRWLREATGLSPEAAHIGKFDIPTCKKVVGLVDVYIDSNITPYKTGG